MRTISWCATLRSVALPALIVGVCALGLQWSYLVFHVLAEGFSIVIALSALTVAGTSQQFTKDRFLTYIAIGIGWCAVLDVVHTLAFKGMGLLPVDGANTATQLWIAARYLQAAVMISAPLFLRRSMSTWHLHVGFGLIVAAVLVSIATGSFPDAYLEGQGLTPFKVYSEYAIILIMALSMVLLWRSRALLAQPVLVAICAALVTMMLGEFAFTRYVRVYATANLIGHLFKIIAYWFIYLALIKWTLREPFRILGEQQIFLDSVVENIPNMIFVKDAKTLKYVRVNKAGEQLLGYAREAMIDKSDYDIFPKAQADVFTAKDREVLDQNRLLDIPKETIKTKVQGERILHTKKIPISEDGKPLYLLGISEDITELELSRDVLRASQERSSIIIQAALDGFWLTDLQGHLLQVNAAYCRMSGYSEQELLGKTISELQARQSASEAEADLQTIVARGWARFETRHRRKDASVFDVMVSVQYQAVNGGQMVCFVTDISERKLLEESQRIVAATFESPEPMIITDANAVIIKVNSSFTRTTGYSAGEAIGQTTRLLLPAQRKPGFYRQIGERVQSVGSWQGEIENRYKNGEVHPTWVAISTIRGTDGVASHYLASYVDLTERKKIEAAIIELNRDISQSRQRLRDMVAQTEERRELERKSIAREVHDELGQVLTALRMDLSLLEMRFGTLDAALVTHAVGMKALVDRAIAGVRNVAGSLRPVAMDLGLGTAIEWLCLEFGRRSQLRCRCVIEEENIDVSEERSVVLFRIVQESLTNIARYAQATQVTVTLACIGNALNLTVQDNGCGFDVAAAEGQKSFGLLGMRERAITLGGKLDISSHPGQGTRIQLTVPLQVAPVGGPT